MMINTTSLKAIMLVASLACSAAVLAQDAPPKAALCAACHGVDGDKPLAPNYPKIKGQNKGYLVSALKAYRDGNRKNAEAMIMKAQATSLSDAEIEALAAFYAAK